ncbi:DNA glycosylase [Petroclostridium sp. X23]|uniref:DNA-3-methyladenine glycosylase family protein n=1 Tax=Petroclostridium sp. X23 TaxID=3045146 RepID=UPI0024ACF29D|nr:DNA glycosylase [Petroclostridium sp. X23]WHH57545.1 DNA glycosylase [Petroclostridium sp. X23]
MAYDYKIFEDNNRVIVQGIRDFNLVHTFECGQCFRWDRQEDESYTGVAFGKVINISVKDNGLIINNTNLEDFNNIWRAYFDLDRDYGTIKEELSRDPALAKATRFGWGIRIVQQEVWECMVSFILSSNNIIPRIKKIIKSISERYGQPIEYHDRVYYSFPRPEDLYQKTAEDMDFCKSGYRCKYILDAARAVMERRVMLNIIKELTTAEARKELMKINGIGPKVADCILLFSLQKYDVFPTDVWIRRVMEFFYVQEDASIGHVQTYSNEQFGDFAGFAQQYLFYYAREMKIGKR